ncbi:LysR family transcriptional regulator [Jannaschia seohaensis]|uniref:LysR family glycine cleavage system transcriptional activator n=1 Tax=Jannaschia seohaensis TaxID=475081 RepID=A0A2Y9C2Z6_9RHOB|nr:LysR family transcriptional regulator [Jannaschia seohaensis]PWJ13266.1 LysR family glycine cleavage system transcriptional activator [Jannaschia seohaensis]SSA50592.1 LysR family transcriptional regulator, glycine cleavage system transcriptional activator [Jannaschia seohaensis]
MTHLNALQALEMATREGSLQAAAERLGITPAAVGQRIRALEKYLDTDLLLRGRSGLQPTPALQTALADLRTAFEALDRVTDTLDFQRSAEIHIVADPDWSDLWLLPRLEAFGAEHPNIQFNVNGEGDVPMRLGAADIIVDRDPFGRAAEGAPLYEEIFLPVGSPEIAARFSDPRSIWKEVGLDHTLPVGRLSDQTRMWWHTEGGSLEGYPLLHIKPRADAPETPGWRDWLARYPYDRTAPERGVRYALVKNAIEGVKSNAGLLVCGLSCILDDLDRGALSLPFPARESLVSPYPYRIRVRPEALARPAVTRFVDWISEEASETKARMDALRAS